MRKLFFTTMTIILAASITHSVSAHALFVDTDPTGKSGESQEITVFYAEPDGEREAIEDWWADVSEFKLWLHRPDGEKVELEVSAQGDHFSSSFVPDAPGHYILSITHAVNQLAGKTQYIFNASAQVVVGRNVAYPEARQHPVDQLVLVSDIDRLKNNKEVSLHYYLDHMPAAHSSLSVFSPAGWNLKIQTQTDGEATFVPEWNGTYLIEGIHKSEVTGKPYEEVVRVYTTQLKIG